MTRICDVTETFLSCKGPLLAPVLALYAFDYVFWLYVSTRTVTCLMWPGSTLCINTNNVVLCVHDHHHMCFVWPDSRCILNVFTPVFLAVRLSLEHPSQTFMSDLNRPTQIASCTHLKECISTSIYRFKIAQPHTDRMCVVRGEQVSEEKQGVSGSGGGETECSISDCSPLGFISV